MSMKRICAKCGQYTPINGRFCCHCGAPVLTPPDALRPGSGPESLAHSQATPAADLARSQGPVRLNAFALISIECLHFSQLESLMLEKPQLEALQRECFDFIITRVQAANGQVESVHKNVVFVSFCKEPTVIDSVDTAVRVSLKLLSETLDQAGVPISLRIGLDLEDTRQRSPLTSVTERSVAVPDAIVMSQRAYDTVGHNRFVVEPLGPVRMGNRQSYYYRALAPRIIIPRAASGAHAPVAESALQMGQVLPLVQQPLPPAPEPSPPVAPLETAAPVALPPSEVTGPPSPAELPAPEAPSIPQEVPASSVSAEAAPASWDIPSEAPKPEPGPELLLELSSPPTPLEEALQEAPFTAQPPSIEEEALFSKAEESAAQPSSLDAEQAQETDALLASLTWRSADFSPTQDEEISKIESPEIVSSAEPQGLSGLLAPEESTWTSPPPPVAQSKPAPRELRPAPSPLTETRPAVRSSEPLPTEPFYQASAALSDDVLAEPSEPLPPSSVPSAEADGEVPAANEPDEPDFTPLPVLPPLELPRASSRLLPDPSVAPVPEATDDAASAEAASDAFSFESQAPHPSVDEDEEDQLPRWIESPAPIAESPEEDFGFFSPQLAAEPEFDAESTREASTWEAETFGSEPPQPEEPQSSLSSAATGSFGFFDPLAEDEADIANQPSWLQQTTAVPIANWDDGFGDVAFSEDAATVPQFQQEDAFWNQEIQPMTSEASAVANPQTDWQPMELAPAEPREEFESEELPFASISEPLPSSQEAVTLASATIEVNDHEDALSELFPGSQGPGRAPYASMQLASIPEFTVPTFGEFRTKRPPNLTYEKAVDTLAARMANFFDGDPVPAAASGLKGMVVSLCGSVGLGKSTILQMARSRVESQDPADMKAIWLGGSNAIAQQDMQVPLGFWLDVLRNFFGLSPDGMMPQEAEAQIAQVLGYLYPDEKNEALAEFFREVLCIRPLKPLVYDAARYAGRMTDHLLMLLRHLASMKPVVLVLEDLENADPASVEVLIQLLRQGMLNLPVFVFASMRRDYHPTGELAELLRLAAIEELVVSDLNESELMKLLEDGPLAEHLGQFPKVFLDHLCQYTDGLPFVLEESLRYLYLNGVLSVNPATGKFMPVDPHGLANRSHLPATVAELISSRMTFLSDPARYVLQLASVLGDKTATGTLMDLSQLEEAAFRQVLQELWDNGWIVPELANGLAFRHAMLWQTVYYGIPAQMRQQMHQLASEYLENGAKNRVTVPPIQIARHAELGGLYKRAFHYWNLAGVHAAQAGSLLGANMALHRALTLLPNSGLADARARQLKLFETLALLNVTTHPDFAYDLLEPALSLTQPGSPKQMELLGLKAQCLESRGQFAERLEVLEQTLSNVSPTEHPTEHIMLQMERMESLFTLGKMAQAQELMTSVVDPFAERFDLSRDPLLLQGYLNARRVEGQVLAALLHPQALVRLEEADRIAQERDMRDIGNLLQLARVQVQLMRGQYTPAQQALNALLPMIESFGGPEAPRSLARWGALAIQSHMAFGDWQNASILVPNSLYQAQQARDFHTWIQVQTLAGQITFGLGNTQEARELIEHAITASADYRLAGTALMGWRAMVALELAENHLDAAVEIAENAIAIAVKPEINYRYEWVLLQNLYAECLLARQDFKSAGKLLETLWTEVLQGGYAPLTAMTATSIGKLYQHLATTVTSSQAQQKHIERAKEFLQKARQLWRDMKNPYKVRELELLLKNC